MVNDKKGNAEYKKNMSSREQQKEGTLMEKQLELNKQYYIDKMMELYDSNDFLYNQGIPTTEQVANYEEVLKLYKEGYYTRENIRKVLYDKLNSEDGLKVKELYEGALEWIQGDSINEWLNKTVTVVPAQPIKKRCS